MMRTRCGGLIMLIALACDLARCAEAPVAGGATDQYAAAVAAENRGDHAGAAARWQKFIAEHPSDERIARAHHYLGACYYQEGKYEQAAEIFEKTIATYPQSDLIEATQIYLGAAQLALGQTGKREMYGRAARTLDALVARNPQGTYVPDAIFFLAESLSSDGKRNEAIGRYEQLIKDFPKHQLVPDALAALGAAREGSGDHAAAIVAYDDFLSRFREHRMAAEVTMRLGEALLADGRPAEAAQRFAALAAKTDSPLADHAALRRADATFQQEHYAEAAPLYTAMAAQFPRSPYVPSAWLGAGRSLFRMERYAEAREVLTKAVQSGSPSAAEALHWLAQTLMRDKKPAQAVAVLASHAPQASSSSWAARLLVDRADALYEIRERRKEAVSLYAEAAAKYPKDRAAPQSLYMAGFVALEMGDAAAALVHAKKFLAAYGDHELAPDALQVVAESSLQLGRLVDADAAYRQLLEKFPLHANVEQWMVRRAVALHAQRKYAETVKLLEPVLENIRSPDRLAEARYLHGSSLLELKRYDEAAKSLGGVLEAQPKWRRADTVLNQLAWCYYHQEKFADAQRAFAEQRTKYARRPAGGQCGPDGSRESAATKESERGPGRLRADS